MGLLGPVLVEAVVELVRAPDDDLARRAEEGPDHGHADAQRVRLDRAVHQPQPVLGRRVCSRRRIRVSGGQADSDLRDSGSES